MIYCCELNIWALKQLKIGINVLELTFYWKGNKYQDKLLKLHNKQAIRYSYIIPMRNAWRWKYFIYNLESFALRLNLDNLLYN